MTDRTREDVAGAPAPAASPADRTGYSPAKPHGPRSPTILVVAVACGLCVANLYRRPP